MNIGAVDAVSSRCSRCKGVNWSYAVVCVVWCRSVKFSAGWCRLVQDGTVWHRLVQFGAGWCSLE